MKKRLFPVLVLFILAAAILPGCGNAVSVKLTADNLAGKRVGVMCGYSSDYILSKPEYKLRISRYDYYADMQLALRFGRLDAAAMEEDEAYVFCRIEPRFQIGLVVRPQTEFAYMFSSSNQQLIKQFNSFLEKFRLTEEYADIQRRVKQSAVVPFVAKKVSNQILTDQVLKVAVFDGWEPVSYINGSTHEWEGADVELVTYFANSLGAKLQLIDMSYNQMLIELGSGMVDLMLCPQSLDLKKDLEMGKNITFSENVFYKDIVLIVNNKEEP